MPRCAIVPPVPVPYREPLFARLAARNRLAWQVIYQSGSQPGWDQDAEWFPASHPYDAVALRARQHARAGRSPIVLPRGLGRALSDYDPACVLSWEYGPATLRALGWCRRRRRPLLLFSELTPDSDSGLTRSQLRLHRLLAPRVAGFVVASSAARRRLVSMGVEASRIEVSIQSADVEAFRQAAARRRQRNGPVRLLAVGRLVPDKNLGLLLEAFAEAGLGDGRAELEICGTGPLEAELRALAERLGVPARFEGFVGSDELPARYAAADAVVLVSTYEPFGVTLREAAAAGLPIVCTRTAGAVGDVAVEGENALLVDPGSPSEIAEALSRLVGDTALRRQLGQGSRAVTERTSQEADAEAFERAAFGALSRVASAEQGR